MRSDHIVEPGSKFIKHDSKYQRIVATCPRWDMKGVVASANSEIGERESTPGCRGRRQWAALFAKADMPIASIGVGAASP
jgi:hypothetical protein